MSLKALYAAATGMEAQQTRINNISNNLANLNTVGFKASRESFEDMIYDQVQTPGTKSSASTNSPIGIQIGHGTRLNGVFKHFTQGELAQTNRELDVAIEGDGFMAVTLDDGSTGYTRDGGLRVDVDGNIVTTRGHIVDPAITIPSDAESITIGKDGTISAILAGQSAATELGTMQISLFQNAAGLKSVGQNLYQETDASGAALTGTPGEGGAGSIIQGFLENSNVNVAEELINLIIAQRSYEANSRVLQTTSEMMRGSSNVS